MEGLLNTLNSYLSSALPVLEWVVFFVVLFALIGIGVKFYTFFDTRNYTYYQPKITPTTAKPKQQSTSRLAKKRKR